MSLITMEIRIQIIVIHDLKHSEKINIRTNKFFLFKSHATASLIFI